MLERYYVTLGASTTSGGKVTSANPFRTIDDVPVAYEDDPVSCPRCQSVGVIKPDGPRISDVFNGKEAALHDDLCICKCKPPPRLIANQTHGCQCIDTVWHAAEVAKKVDAVSAC